MPPQPPSAPKPSRKPRLPTPEPCEHDRPGTRKTPFVTGPSPVLRPVWGILALTALCASGAIAQVYKWVDANGRTHYSERKSDAPSARAKEVKITSPQALTPSPRSSPADDPHRRRGSEAPADPKPTFTPSPTASPAEPVASEPERLRAKSDGRDHGTDASRCALAQDVLSGAVRHGNGKPTDKYDIDVAQNDVKAFCR